MPSTGKTESWNLRTSSLGRVYRRSARSTRESEKIRRVADIIEDISVSIAFKGSVSRKSDYYALGIFPSTTLGRATVRGR